VPDRNGGATPVLGNNTGRHSDGCCQAHARRCRCRAQLCCLLPLMGVVQVVGHAVPSRGQAHGSRMSTQLPDWLDGNITACSRLGASRRQHRCVTRPTRVVTAHSAVCRASQDCSFITAEAQLALGVMREDYAALKPDVCVLVRDQAGLCDNLL